MKTVFFYGSLRDPALLEIVLGRPVDPAAQCAATAPDHAAMRLGTEAYPALVPAPGDRAEGVLVHGLDDADLARLAYFEEAEYALAPLRLDTAAGPVEAVHFRPTGKALLTTAPWDFAAWQRRDRAVAHEAARELMAHFGHIPLERIDDIWPGIMIRARMRARARAAAPVTGDLRQARSPDDIVPVAIERPYTRYFAIEEHRLRHRRLDGRLGAPIDRTVVATGDAVTLLPYDPARGLVLMVEQFRAPVHARGDAAPWVIETIAGRIDTGENPEATARREAREEAGLDIGAVERVAEVYSTPGFATEFVTCFVGLADLDTAGGPFGLAAEGEDIRAFTAPLERALDAIATGEINTAPAVLSLLWLQTHHARLAQGWG